MVASVDEVRGLVEAVSYRGTQTASGGGRSASPPFITISRQAGAGGHLLAEALLARFSREPDDSILHGWRIVDRELCEQVLLDPGVRVSFETLERERYRTQFEDMLMSVTGIASPQHMVIKRLIEVMRRVALQGRVILVGRAGMCATRGLSGGVHVRLVASEDVRLMRLAERMGLTLEAARALLYRKDHDRTRLVQEHFLRNIDDPLLYDAVWNTNRGGFDEIAEALAAIVRLRVQTRCPLAV